MSDYIFSQLDLTSSSGIIYAMLLAIACGLIITLVYRLGAEKPSKYMTVTLIIMPTVVQTVIMLVNGSIGTGVAVAGAFSLIRFRSVPGTSRDICILFYAMAAGIATGMGYAGYSLLFTILIAVLLIIAEKVVPSDHPKNSRVLKVLIPEDMDYSDAFDDIFKEYTSFHRLEGVRTVQMGTMYELTFTIAIKNISDEKQLIDKIRARNGNLTIKSSLLPVARDEL